MKKNKYKLGEEFLEITFQIPKPKKKIEYVANDIFISFPEAVNVKIIPCKIVIDPARLSVSKDNYSFTIWKPKEESQIMKKGGK